MNVKRIDRLKDNTWVVKDKEYRDVIYLKYLEDKLEYVREIINKLLEEDENTN